MSDSSSHTNARSANTPIYLDYNATTPVDERVLAKMTPYFTAAFGNAASRDHAFGWDAAGAVNEARYHVASLINARPDEIIFTGCSTESINLALKGVAQLGEGGGRAMVTSAVEHEAVLGACRQVEAKTSVEVNYLGVDGAGRIDLEELANSVGRSGTLLVSLMFANNEIGTIQPVAEIGALVGEARAAGRRHLWLHTDAVQAAGRMPFDVETLGCDLLSLSAHKLNAPKGCGALFVRRSVRLVPQSLGGHQERERRAGTEAVASIVAFGAAAALAREELDERTRHMRHLRDRFETGVVERISDIVFNGDRAHRLPHLSNISFRFIEGEGLLINLDMQGVAVSTGSACSSGSLEPSPVIRALGRDDELARGSIRFSLGKETTDADIDYVLEVLPRAVSNLRRLSPLYQKALAERACQVA